jgi:prepilin-type N-terminal cleavage/methylation domain-containing protein
MRREHGFTLVELMIAMTLMLVVVGTTLTAFGQFQTINERTQSQNDSQDKARATLDQMARDLRNAGAVATDDSQAFATATATDVAFQTVDPTGGSTGNVRHVEWVRYCLDTSTPSNELVWRQVLTWAGAVTPRAPFGSVCPDTSSGTRTVVRDHVVNYNSGSAPLFSYFPTPASSPPSSSDLSRIARISVDMFVNYDSRRDSHPTELQTGVYLRNVAQAPSAAFTADTGSGAGSVYLNASSSSDPAGLPLTYLWCDTTAGGGCSTTSNGIGQSETLQYSQPSGTTHTITLLVTNSAGATDTTSKQVTIP